MFSTNDVLKGLSFHFVQSAQHNFLFLFYFLYLFAVFLYIEALEDNVVLALLRVKGKLKLQIIKNDIFSVIARLWDKNKKKKKKKKKLKQYKWTMLLFPWTSIDGLWLAK